MPTCRFAILEHTTDAGVHHDLLIEDPALAAEAEPADDPGDALTLWAVRIDPPPGAWLARQPLLLTPLPPHRARYLTYEGPLTAGRGSVRHLADGYAEVRCGPDEARHIRLTLDGPTLAIVVPQTVDDQPLRATVTAVNG